MSRGPRRAKGHLPSKVRFDAHGHPLRAQQRFESRVQEGDLPKESSLLSHVPLRMNQNVTGSCTWHAAACAIVTALSSAGTPLGWVPSQLDGYAGTRALSRAHDTPVGHALPPLTDDGAEPIEVMRWAASHGVTEQRLVTSEQILNRSDCTAANINLEPDFNEVRKARQHLTVGERLVGPGRTAPTDVARVIAVERRPVTIASFVDMAFEQWMPSDGPIGVPDYADPEGGGHYIVIHSYLTDPHWGRLFVIRNSWDGWGDSNGDALVTEAWVRQASDIYAFSVSLKGAS